MYMQLINWMLPRPKWINNEIEELASYIIGKKIGSTWRKLLRNCNLETKMVITEVNRGKIIFNQQPIFGGYNTITLQATRLIIALSEPEHLYNISGRVRTKFQLETKQWTERKRQPYLYVTRKELNLTLGKWVRALYMVSCYRQALCFTLLEASALLWCWRNSTKPND